MIVRFSGPAPAEVEVVPGERLLDAAWRARQPLEGTCNGQLACATCHVQLDDPARFPPPSPEEEDMLDLVPAATRRSRLACQLIVPSQGAPLTVTVPTG